MFQYEKALQYPVKIARPNAKLAKIVMSQLGGLNSKKIYKKPAEDQFPCRLCFTPYSVCQHTSDRRFPTGPECRHPLRAPEVSQSAFRSRSAPSL